MREIASLLRPSRINLLPFSDSSPSSTRVGTIFLRIHDSGRPPAKASDFFSDSSEIDKLQPHNFWIRFTICVAHVFKSLARCQSALFYPVPFSSLCQAPKLIRKGNSMRKETRGSCGSRSIARSTLTATYIAACISSSAISEQSKLEERKRSAVGCGSPQRNM